MLIGWLVLLFLALLALNIPVCFVLLIISTVYVFAKDVPLAVLGHVLTTSTDSFILTAIPLFILAAYMMDKGDVSNRIIDFSRYQWQRGFVASGGFRKRASRSSARTGSAASSRAMRARELSRLVCKCSDAWTTP